MPKVPGLFYQPLYNPLSEFIRGTEGDVLFILAISDYARSGSDIARWAERSKAEVHKVLYWLRDKKLVNSSRSEEAIWWWMNDDHPLSRQLRRLCDEFRDLDKVLPTIAAEQ